MDLRLQEARDSVPPGRWALGISGGADSVALCQLLRSREDVALHLVHLDHELRGRESAGDAAFVAELARRWDLPLTLRRLSQLPAAPDLPENPQARYRALRQRLFGEVVQQQQLAGIVLAHHADDQAETVLLRLIRSAGVQGLAAIPQRAQIAGLHIFRPLLNVPGQLLRDYLREQPLSWREDSSNASGKYLRNRVRQHLRRHPDLAPLLLQLAQAAGAVQQWLEQESPRWDESVPLAEFGDLPRLLQRHALRRWLVRCGMPENEISVSLLERLTLMATDAASPPRMQVPGGIGLARQRGRLYVL